jgi:hypothetical protein
LAARAGSLDLEVPGGLLAAIGNDLVLDVLTFIESAESSFLNRRDVDEHVFAAAASGGLNESETLLDIEPFHGACRHRRLLKNRAQMRPLPRDYRAAADPNSALSSEGPIRGEHQTRPELEWTKCNRSS